jgi:hypothetical protein
MTQEGIPRRLSVRIGAAFVIPATLGILLVPLPAHSQAQTPALSIASVDMQSFPQITLQVSARDASGAPIDPLQSSDLRVLEDGQELPVSSVQPSDVPMRVVFVVSPGDGYSYTGVKLASVFATARDDILAFATGKPWMQPDADQAAVLVYQASNIVLAPMSGDPQAIANQVEGYAAPSDNAFTRASPRGAYTRAALNQALDVLSAGAVEGQPQALVLFTGGDRADFADVAERAIAMQVPIHVVLTRRVANAYWEEALRPLAQVTAGGFFEASELGNADEVFSIVTAARRRNAVQYRSTSASASQRQVVLELRSGGQTLSATAQYAVSLQPPRVTILAPAEGDVITRKAARTENPAADAEPAFTQVTAGLEWLDGYPRAARQARLIVNRTIVAEADLTSGQPVFNWDIRSYQSRERLPATLQVEVEDELGLTAASAPVNVSIAYSPPPGLHLSTSALTWVAVVVALASLGVALYLFFNRTRLAPAFQHAGDGFVDFVDRVTGRRTALVAKAYLVPLEGFEHMPSKAFELYGTTAIGRSRRHADLLFHIHEEDSPISRLHCTILDADDHFALRDEDSSNGTFVNGEKLTALEPLMLHDGDLIDVAPLERGGLRFLFQLAAPDGELPANIQELRQTRPRRGPQAES